MYTVDVVGLSRVGPHHAGGCRGWGTGLAGEALETLLLVIWDVYQDDERNALGCRLEELGDLVEA
jgi:hypothetical protein